MFKTEIRDEMVSLSLTTRLVAATKTRLSASSVPLKL